MLLANTHRDGKCFPQRRKFPRYDVQCRARIRIGNRQYAGYVHNISRGGAKLRTITPIRKLGSVILRLPDLPPLCCGLRWTDAFNAGVSFEMLLSASKLARWARTRSSSPDCKLVAEIVELEEHDF
ncbi:MAG TPA: PilZ domain-containing protein [Sphingomicrobium sp.]|nr:PilZ domain-containing protein [Sphingomicrobium sp.]